MKKERKNEVLFDDDIMDDYDVDEEIDEVLDVKNDNDKSRKKKQAEARLRLEDILEERSLKREIEDYF
jgi:hypothetical protein